MIKKIFISLILIAFITYGTIMTFQKNDYKEKYNKIIISKKEIQTALDDCGKKVLEKDKQIEELTKANIEKDDLINEKNKKIEKLENENRKLELENERLRKN